MKNVFVAILFLSIAFGFGQDNTAPKEDVKLVKENVKDSIAETDYNQIFMSVQVPAEPPGGMNALENILEQISDYLQCIKLLLVQLLPSLWFGMMVQLEIYKLLRKLLLV